MKILQFFQYAYLIIAVLFLYKAISEWSTDRNGAYMSLFFAALAIFMFFFRKRFRKKFEDRNKQ
ncbi:hypothetical protein [Winogradskyella flava]|uniref:Uncharacterized protein n=1 Tax=Winogradskyella flava TaxID=1884876 RepID=A0A842IRI6_9FLAO|nr:hypothetical protein [Winogradskyella flava]MBC2844436.1 hypothetical protein [Winogradskyella flava]